MKFSMSRQEKGDLLIQVTALAGLTVYTEAKNCLSCVKNTTEKYWRHCFQYVFLLTFRPKIWLIAADSFKVHSFTTFCLSSFINSINAFILDSHNKTID